MKNSLFIFLFLSTLSLSSCQIFRRAPVVDTDKNILRSGTNYYVLPVVHVVHGSGGGLTLAGRSGKSCPLDVIQEVSEGRNGLPLNFVSSNKDGVIRESVDLNIKFTDASTCAPDAVWRVDVFNGKRTLSSQGLGGRPRHETISNWFKIEKFDDHYKLVYCPSVCNTCKPICSDIGSAIGEKGRRSLVLDKSPLRMAKPILLKRKFCVLDVAKLLCINRCTLFKNSTAFKARKPNVSKAKGINTC